MRVASSKWNNTDSSWTFEKYKFKGNWYQINQKKDKTNFNFCQNIYTYLFLRTI